MSMTRTLGGRAIALLATPALYSCARATAPATAPATSPTTAPATASAMVTFEDKKDNIRLQYPDHWKTKPDKDDVLMLVAADGKSDRNLTFDIPELPPHLPGMIQLGLIENGYIKDQKKQHPGIKMVKAADDARCGGGKGRLVEMTWEQNHKTYTDLGLLIMRKDVVYVFSADASAEDLAAVRTDFDKIAASLTWTK